MSVTFLHAAQGGITIKVSISRSIFEANPPVCILAGATLGGRPSFYVWTKDGASIRNSTYFSIGQDYSRTRYLIIYVSMLTVKGRFPGVYAYTVRNERESGYITANINLTSMYIHGTYYDHIMLQAKAWQFWFLRWRVMNFFQPCV